MGTAKRKLRELKEEIYIIGEGITEQYYFGHLKQLNRYNCVVKPRFFGKTSLDEIDKTSQKLLLGGVTVVCVFDADVSEREAVEKKKLHQFIRKYKNNKGIIICDSLPTIEFWFLLHFIKKSKVYQNSKEVERELRQHIHVYRKNKEFLENIKWVEKMNEKLEIAYKNAKEIEKREGFSYSNIYKAIDLLEKIQN